MTSKIKVDNINKVSDDSNIIKKCGTTITLGASGDSIALASGASQTGFGRTGTVDWQTTPKTSTFTASNGEGYFCNTTSGAFTVNLPAGSAGAIISLADYANTWQTNQITLTPNGSEKINGATGGNSAFLNTEGQSVTLVYIDGTQGWKTVQDSTSDVTGAGSYIIASGGTPSTSGDYKIHTFTGPGTFTVTCSGPGSLGVDYLVVAGGGGGGGSKPGYHSGGGGGAGGFRESVPSPAAWTASPIAASGNARPVSVQAYTITVGGGGAGGTGGNPGPSNTNGTVGNVSTFSDITSAGGGYGGASRYPTGANSGGNGGSGGGGGGSNPGGPNIGGTGNTPPVSPAQGFDGGDGTTPTAGVGGGGGGALGAGVDGSPGYGKAGGPGATTHISSSPVVYAIGGASGTEPGVTPTTPVNSGTGGQSGGNCASNGAAGGSGIVILRYKFQN